MVFTSYCMNKKRILLVNVETSALDHVHSMPVGLLHLASYLSSKIEGSHIQILDQKIDAISVIDIAQKVKNENFGILGLSCFSAAADNAVCIARATKGLSPETTVVIGGPHSSAFLEDALLPGFDYAVFGEGEPVFAALVSALISGENPENPSGLIYRRGDEIIKGPSASVIENLDSLPLPAWDKIDLRPYWRREGFGPMGKRPYASIMTSRGCPFCCTYCHKIFGKRYRSFSADYVLEEIRCLSLRYGLREFEFLDDAFNLDKNRALDILNRIQAEFPKVKLLFSNGVCSDALDGEVIEAMERAGTCYISFAVESGSPRVQHLIKKNLDLGAVSRNIDTCAKSGKIFLNGFFMLGFPGETREEMEQTIDFALNQKLNTVSFFLLMPFKGTEIYESLNEQQKTQIKANPDKMYYDSLAFNFSGVSDKELARIHSMAFRRFYLRFSSIFKTLKIHPRPMDFILTCFAELMAKFKPHFRSFFVRLLREPV